MQQDASNTEVYIWFKVEVLLYTVVKTKRIMHKQSNNMVKCPLTELKPQGLMVRSRMSCLGWVSSVVDRLEYKNETNTVMITMYATQ